MQNCIYQSGIYPLSYGTSGNSICDGWSPLLNPSMTVSAIDAIFFHLMFPFTSGNIKSFAAAWTRPSALIDFKYVDNFEEWLETIKETVPEKFLDINIKAFCEGYES